MFTTTNTSLKCVQYKAIYSNRFGQDDFCESLNGGLINEVSVMVKALMRNDDFQYLKMHAKV